MVRGLERNNIQQLLHVARLYYEKNMTQSEIAARIGFSRPTVSRLLEEARSSGVVTITISHPMERIFSLEDELAASFGLEIVRVSDSSAGDSIESIGQAAAQLLAELGGNRMILAVSNGRSIAATVNHMPVLHWEKTTVVQMIGAVGDGLLPEDSPAVCRRMARRIGGTYAQMPVPLVLENPELVRALKREEQISSTLALAQRADIALVGVGATADSEVGRILRPYLTEELTQQILATDAVGHITGHHFNAAGHHVWTPLCERTLALELEALRNIPLRIGVVAGAEKVEAIKGAIAGGYISVLVTDASTARALLQR
ncbi:MAG: sugar-binding transcriptional regulator [Actinomycetaceae bacterium]|nr:sugar-binding transcriptional regulator [Actinomycetaceae bacterium]